MVKIGDVVTYVDPLARPCPSVVTAVWGGQPLTEAQEAEGREKWGWTDEVVAVVRHDRAKPPSLNVIFVSKDEAKHDDYGRQIERETSVPHQSVQAAHGNYWREP